MIVNRASRLLAGRQTPSARQPLRRDTMLRAQMLPGELAVISNAL